jgi:hypothetical protein
MSVIPATQEVEIRRMEVQDQLGQNSETPSQQISWAWWFLPVISMTGGMTPVIPGRK